MFCAAGVDTFQVMMALPHKAVRNDIQRVHAWIRVGGS